MEKAWIHVCCLLSLYYFMKRRYIEGKSSPKEVALIKCRNKLGIGNITRKIWTFHNFIQIAVYWRQSTNTASSNIYFVYEMNNLGNVRAHTILWQCCQLIGLLLFSGFTKKLLSSISFLISYASVFSKLFKVWLALYVWTTFFKRLNSFFQNKWSVAIQSLQ